MESVNLFFLHGFLGQPSDWLAVKETLPRSRRLKIYTPNILRDKELGPENSFEVWAHHFNTWAKGLSQAGEKNILVGYSLGGRLALHALQAAPDFWYRLFVVSSHPGFKDNFTSFNADSEERRQRWLNDSYWAEEFQIKPWQALVKNWNSLPIFQGGKSEPAREEGHYTRDMLSLALTNWSLAQQKNLRELISLYKKKIYWVVGEHDTKFMALAQELAEDIPQLMIETIDDASHRVIFDQPQLLGRKISSLLHQLL